MTLFSHRLKKIAYVAIFFLLICKIFTTFAAYSEKL